MGETERNKKIVPIWQNSLTGISECISEIVVMQLDVLINYQKILDGEVHDINHQLYSTRKIMLLQRKLLLYLITLEGIFSENYKLLNKNQIN